jgi:PhzF family phenazine biosynthesis protein
MSLKIVQIDAFASRPFEGNPAAVCLVPDYPSDEWLLSVAREMNLSETAFLKRRDGDFELRWFTPEVEVELCGHATLASAHYLWQEGLLDVEQAARFYTLSGWLTAKRRGEWIEMDFPAAPPEIVEPSRELLEALGIEARLVGRNRFDYLVEVESETILRAVRPDFELLAEVCERGVMVTCRADEPGYDFVSRFFAPAVGVDEDPVTGSAHCCLAPFWSERLGKEELIGFQASRRGGVVRTRILEGRVLLAGQAVTVLSGQLHLEVPSGSAVAS